MFLNSALALWDAHFFPHPGSFDASLPSVVMFQRMKGSSLTAAGG